MDLATALREAGGVAWQQQGAIRYEVIAMRGSHHDPRWYLVTQHLPTQHQHERIYPRRASDSLDLAAISTFVHRVLQVDPDGWQI